MARLLVLAGLLEEVLGGSSAGAVFIDDGLVELALRHEVAAMLLRATVRHGVTPQGLSRLQQAYDNSVVRRANSLARLEIIAQCFKQHAIAWMALKGAIQAGLLYEDPAWRVSGDIDILVAPQDFRRALAALAELGFIASNPPLPRGLRVPIAAAVRDVTLIAGDDRDCAVELHRRLFLAGGPPQVLPFSRAPGSVPAPGVDAALAFYHIAHGARSFWVRLKWLVDLVPLLAKLRPGEPQALVELARRAGAEQSLAASLMLLQVLFPHALPPVLAPWLARQEVKPEVRRRLLRYFSMLNLKDDQKGSPLSNALVMLEAEWLLFDRISARLRLLLAAPLSSAMRRLAGMMAPSERALTLPR